MNKHNSYYLLEVVDMDTDETRELMRGHSVWEGKGHCSSEKENRGPAAVWVGWGFLGRWNWKCKDSVLSLGGLRPMGLEENKRSREYLQERCRRWPEKLGLKESCGSLGGLSSFSEWDKERGEGSEHGEVTRCDWQQGPCWGKTVGGGVDGGRPLSSPRGDGGWEQGRWWAVMGHWMV